MQMQSSGICLSISSLIFVLHSRESHDGTRLQDHIPKKAQYFFAIKNKNYITKQSNSLTIFQSQQIQSHDTYFNLRHTTTIPYNLLCRN